VSKSLVIFLCATLVMAGCSSMPPRVDPTQPLPPDWDSELGPVHEIEGTVPQRPAPSPAQATKPNPPSRPTLAPLTTAESGMISLNRWAMQNGLGSLRTIPLTPNPAHSVATPHGNRVVQANSLVAYWDRLEVRLGFMPQQIGNQIFLHALDIRKLVEPLAHGVSVSTPADRLVVIDPGHGGSNLGTRNIATGHHEKEYTLDWARRLAKLLEQSGWRVLLTRTNDVEMTLAERTAFADAHQADLFVSLHFNSAGENSEPAGLETYCLTPTGMQSSLTRGDDDDASQAFPNNNFDGDNLRYAVRIHRAMLPVTGNVDRGVRHARFLGVLRGQRRPAVLVEGGYLSNPREAKLVADPAHRQKLAEAIAKALE
jgi:N-acetylmuramoyl-L-alanine amidase